MSTYHTHSISSFPTKKPSTVLWKLFGLILSGIYASRPELTNINYIENLAQSPFYAGLSRKFPYILTLTLSLKLKRRNFTLIISSSFHPQHSHHSWAFMAWFLIQTWLFFVVSTNWFFVCCVWPDRANARGHSVLAVSAPETDNNYAQSDG